MPSVSSSILPAQHLLALASDRYHGIDTESNVTLGELGVDESKGTTYEPTPAGHFRNIMRSLELGPEEVFIDIGSGKGRSLLLAARYPFHRVIGVNISSALIETSKRNVEKMAPRLRCQRIDHEVADATTYELPDDVTIIYFFNPLFADIMIESLRSARRSIDRCSRDVRVIYYNPRYHVEITTALGLEFEREMVFANLGLFHSRAYFYRLRAP